MELLQESQKRFVLSTEFSDLAKSKEYLSDKRGLNKNLAVDRAVQKLSPKVRQLLDDYSKLYKEYQDLGKENVRLQGGIARYFKEHLQGQEAKDGKKTKHESKEESARNAEEAEIEHQRRYENTYRIVKDLNKKIIAAKEDSKVRGEVIKSTAEEKEIQVKAEWRSLLEKQLQTAKATVFRDGQPLEAAIVTEYQEKIGVKLKAWRVVGMKGAVIWIKKHNLEEQLRKLDNFGGDLSLNHYDELKAMSRLHQECNDESVKELEAARLKQAHSSQVVAHLSEKVAYLKVLKKDLVDKMDWLSHFLAVERQKLNKVKIQRDKVRKERQEIKETTGIMFSPNLLHDLEKKIVQRNDLIRQMQKANQYFLDVVAGAKHALPVDPVTHMRNMARGDLPLLPETVDDETSMNLICCYDGRQKRT